MLKNIDRIEAFPFVYFVSLIVESFIELETRINMVRYGRKSIQVDSEFMSNKFPTTDRSPKDFSMVQISRIKPNGKMLKKFLPNLTRRH